MGEQIAGGEPILGGEESVVHLPEAVLFTGSLGCLGGELGMRVRRADRGMPEDVPQPVPELLPQVRDRTGGTAAEGAIEVAVLDQGQRR